MAPSHILQILLRVAIQNQIRVAQRVVVDEVIQLGLLRHGHIQRVFNPGAVDGGYTAAGQGREADHDPRHGRSRPRRKGGGFYRCPGWGGEGQAPGKGCGPG